MKPSDIYGNYDYLDIPDNVKKVLSRVFVKKFDLSPNKIYSALKDTDIELTRMVEDGEIKLDKIERPEPPPEEPKKVLLPPNPHATSAKGVFIGYR